MSVNLLMFIGGMHSSLIQCTLYMPQSNGASIQESANPKTIRRKPYFSLNRGHKEMSSFWLTNGALVYEPKCVRWGVLRGLSQ